MFAGFGGSVLGHCHPDLVRKAVNEQANQLWAVGNQFYSEPQIHVADHLNRTTTLASKVAGGIFLPLWIGI